MQLKQMPAVGLAVMLTWFYVSCPRAAGFKLEDFKKCADSAFCTRLRGAVEPGYTVTPGSIKVHGAYIDGLVVNTTAGVTFNLRITAYSGTARIHITEAGSAQPRFEVPFVLSEDLGQHQKSWNKVKRQANSLRARLGDSTAELRLQYDPFMIDLGIDNRPAVSINSRQMFQIEHHRKKQEGDPAGWWEEVFKGHTDAKPKGPEAISLDIVFPGIDNVYGIPEHATRLSLEPTAGDGIESEPYRLYNLDVFEYLHDSPFGLYGSIPFMLGHRPGLTIGAFWLNAAEMYIDVDKAQFGTQTQWIAEAGVVDLFLMTGPTPSQVLAQYGYIAGTTALPQEFAIGYHQCRWNYRDEADVAAVDAGFDANDIPYDVLWLDIEHTDGKKYFTWDPVHFPHPVPMQEDLASRGRKMVTIIDPHIKRDPGYYVYAEAEKGGYFVKNKDGGDYEGWCWPGSSSYLDMLNPDVQAWWTSQFALEKYRGSTKHLYVWNDMNEPSVFNGPEITMDKHNLHVGGVEHRELHNMNGLLFHNATAAGMVARGNSIYGPTSDRPFVLSRAFFAGTQRVGPIWTGDNAATWEHLRISVPMLLSLGLAGLPFSGADVGGFFGNPDPELLVRWNQVATFYPFFRGHAHLDTKRREPWLFGDENTNRIRAAIRARYVLLPYMYTLFRHSHLAAQPVMRPLWFEFPEVAATFSVDDEFLLGPALLVAPVMEPGLTSRTVYLPPGPKWFNASTGEEVLPDADRHLEVAVTMDSVPTFLRGGSILAIRERARRSSTAMAGDPYTLLVVLDALGTAAGDLYLDDGCSFAYQSGAFLHRMFNYKSGRLSSSTYESLDEDKANPYVPPAGAMIDRIAIVGLSNLQATRHAKLEGREGRDLDVSPGPLAVQPGLADSVLIIRKPGLPLDMDWTVRIS